MVSRKNLVLVDIFRIIMAIFVVAIHTKPFHNFNLDIFERLFDFAVPFFFIATSYFFFNKFYTQENKEELINNYIIKNLKSYFIWTLVYLPLAIYGYIFIYKFGLLKSIIIYMKDLVFVGEHYYSWPLWFLLSIIYTFVFYKVLFKKIRTNPEYKILCFSIIIYLLANIFTLLANKNMSFDYSNNVIFVLINKLFNNGRLFTGMLYMSIGMILAKYNKKKNLFYLMVAFSFSLISYLITRSFLLLPIASVFLFSLLLNLNLNTKMNLTFLRKISVVFYFLHMMFFFLFDLITGVNSNYGFGAFLFTSFACLISSCYIYHFRNNKFLKQLFS